MEYKIIGIDYTKDSVDVTAFTILQIKKQTMKKYKLKKEFQELFINLGLGIEILGKNIKNNLEKEFTEESIKNKQLGKQFFEEIKKKTIYNMEEGDMYYVIYSDGGIGFVNFHDSETDKGRLESGNAFLTREEVEKEKEKRKAGEKIKKWIVENDDDYKFKFGRTNWYITPEGDSDFNSILGFYIRRTSELGLNFYFSSEEKAKQCLEELTDCFNLLYNI